MAIAYNTYSTTTNATNYFITTQEEPMKDGAVVDQYPEKMNIRSVEMIDGWVGQLIWGDEVIWQSKKARRDKKDKYDNIIEGSYLALEDARKHKRACVRKLYKA
jgi:hypothetical protein